METVAEPQPPSGACEHCGKKKPIMVAMKPGKDGLPWSLCSGCYLDGLRPMNQIGAEKKVPRVTEVSPEMADALQKSGWKVADEKTLEASQKTKTRKKRSA